MSECDPIDDAIRQMCRAGFEDLNRKILEAPTRPMQGDVNMSEREADYRIEDEHAHQCQHDGEVWTMRICAECGTPLGPPQTGRDGEMGDPGETYDEACARVERLVAEMTVKVEEAFKPAGISILDAEDHVVRFPVFLWRLFKRVLRGVP